MIVKLTPDELAGRAERMAALELAYNEQKIDADMLARTARVELKAKRDEITKLAREIDAGEQDTVEQLEIAALADAVERELEDEPEPEEEEEQDFDL